MNVAVLLATYNGEQYLEEQLNSIFKQTFDGFTLYIHDDGSSDRTIEIINEYLQQYPGKIQVLEGAPCRSAKKNFLWMLSKVDSDYYFFCDQDDVWLPEKIRETLSEIISTEKKSDNTPVAVFTDMKVVDENLNILSDSFIRYIGRSYNNIAYTQILIDNPAAGCTMCVNKSLRNIAIAATGIDYENVPMHDAWLLEIAALFGVVRGMDKPFVLYRQTGRNTMGASTETKSDKISRNARLVTSGNFFEKKKQFISEARLFSKEIIKIEDIPEDKKTILNQFIKIEEKNKISRVIFYKKNNFTRAKHNMWMYFWV